MLVNIKVTGGLHNESGHIDPKATQGLSGLQLLELAEVTPSRQLVAGRPTAPTCHS